MFWRSAKIKKVYGTLKFLLTQYWEGWGAGNFKISYSFYPISAKLFEDIGGMYLGYYFYLAISHILKLLCTLKFLHGTQWENSKMCDVLKMADCRAKLMKV